MANTLDHIFLQSASHRRTSTNMSSSRRSIFGSIKQKFSKKPSDDKLRQEDPYSSRQSSWNSRSEEAVKQSQNKGSPFAGNAGSSSSNPFADAAPPPAYTEATGSRPPAAKITVQDSSRDGAKSPTPSGASAFSVASLSTPEDPYAFLSTFDTVFLIDDSGSMAGTSWREVGQALKAITPICTAHDSDGIDLYFLNSRSNSHRRDAGGWSNIRSADQVEQLFNSVRASGGTPTGTRINNILSPYLKKYEEAVKANGGDPENTGVKPVNLIVITDGVPTDDPEQVIIRIAKKLDKLDAPSYQVGIQFFQVGNEPGAREALEDLDDRLREHSGNEDMRDMVDAVTWSGGSGSTRPQLSASGMLKVVLGSVVKRLDRRRMSGESRRRGHLAP
ncbi:collagen alpha-5 chain [Diplogelasinospora grovesii]|uniref:Collagen alpha-5 chain n=1 Tax=Diplogelasinospora grovesii TaxID=303347 RepID=A0AAN6S8L9_9PEZI|nr:collagen alpha-5 chain [Diplogelasinospora grovesii]